MTEEKTSVHSIAELLGNKGKTQHAYLIVISAKSPALVGKMYKLERTETVVGRSLDSELQVEDDGISRKHAKLMMSASGDFQVVDLGSTNGTFLNGVRVDIAPLRDGDKLQVGSHTVLKFSLQDQLEEQYQRSIYESATRDGLTRLFNKKYFVDMLRKEFAYCVRHHVPLSVVMFDVDHFKAVNDTYGHLAGDYVLARIAQRVNDTIRTEDLLSRYGGEEFAILLRESSEEQAIKCAERCRRAVDGSDFLFSGVPVRATISMGVATLNDGQHSTPEELLNSADQFLYRAKRNGRNRVDAFGIGGAT
jgi:diguanylate cyclase (GGDEF)-like protein